MRFDNIDDGPDVEDIKITWLSLEGDTISMPKDLACTALLGTGGRAAS